MRPRFRRGGLGYPPAPNIFVSSTPTGFGVITHAIVVFGYLFALLAIGAWKVRRVRTQADFALAGRDLSPVVLFGTLLATWIGTDSIFGNAEKTVEIGAADLDRNGDLGGRALRDRLIPRWRE